MEDVYIQQLRHATPENLAQTQGRLDTYEELFNYIKEKTK
jgi:hypothetical protein